MNNPHQLSKRHIIAMEKIYTPLVQELKRRYATYEKFEYARNSDVFVTFDNDPDSYMVIERTAAYSKTLGDSQEYDPLTVCIMVGKIHVTYKLRSMVR